MPQRARRFTFLSMPEVDHLRQLVIHLHDDRQVSRDEIASHARINATDLDNFIGRKASGSYKTLVPREAFQRRLLRYLLTRREFTAAEYLPREPRGIEFSADPREDPPDELTPEEHRKVTLGRYWSEFARSYSTVPMAADIDIDLRLQRNLLFRFDTLDRMFELLSEAGLANERSCREICDALAGDYYAYRYSSRETAALRSHVSIERYDIYSRTPKYLSKFKESQSGIRETRGNIFRIGAKYIFIGLTAMANRTERTHLGINLSVLHSSQEQRGVLVGFYVSCDQAGDYNVGNVKFVRTVDKFDEGRIGEVPLPHPDVTAEELAIDILEFKELLGHSLGAKLFERGKVARSIKYYTRKPRPRRVEHGEG